MYLYGAELESLQDDWHHARHGFTAIVTVIAAIICRKQIGDPGVAKHLADNPGDMAAIKVRHEEEEDGSWTQLFWLPNYPTYGAD